MEYMYCKFKNANKITTAIQKTGVKVGGRV
jgi:hypothetical protein